MHCPREYFDYIGPICIDSLRNGNGLSALLTRAAKKRAAESSATKTRSMESGLKKEDKRRTAPKTDRETFQALDFTVFA